jgi:glycerophosphoryl diester phosphodiesterase
MKFLALGTSLLLTCFQLSAQQIYIPKFDLQGHRGARGLKPENSIPAFLIALDSGVTTVELDLAVTSDQQIIVSHEPWMAASICTQPDGQPIRERDEKKFNIYKMTYADVTLFDCGLKGNEKFPQQEKVKTSKPLLKDVIAAIEEHIRNYTQYEVDYNIEIKTEPAGDNKFHPTPRVFSDMVYALLDEYLPMERVIIQSFDFRVLKYFHEKYPDLRLAALVENNRGPEKNLEELGFNPSIYSPYFELLTAQQVKDLQRMKVRVIPWTVNELADMKKMRAFGVDGFITDYPDRAATLGLGIRRKL